MNKRAILAALVGGVAMYAWSSIAHLVLPISRVGWNEIPGEQPVLASMQTALGQNAGLYMYPALGTDSMDQYGKKLATSPSGMLIYFPPGRPAMEPAQLIIEFISEMVFSLLAIFLLAQTSIKTFGGRTGFVTMAGMLASIVTNVPYWNWYGFPTNYTLASITMQVVGFAAAGAAAAVVMKNRALRDA
jgi:hypothetical protein